MTHLDSSTWTEEHTWQAIRKWQEYEREHDTGPRVGQTAGIDPVSGSVWFGRSAKDIVRQFVKRGEQRPLYFVRIGRDYYVRKGGLSAMPSTEGEPAAEIVMPAGRPWTAMVDTGFNGELELPEGLKSQLSHTYLGRSHSLLAGGQTVEEELYLVDFPFGGSTIVVEANFIFSGIIVIGTSLLRDYLLEIDFPRRTLTWGKVAQEADACNCLV